MEQKRLEKLADNIGENLQYYSFLEPITRKLNAPGAGSFVRGKEFSDMLARLDECLEYMDNHVCLHQVSTNILTSVVDTARSTYIQIKIQATPDSSINVDQGSFCLGIERYNSRCE